MYWTLVLQHPVNPKTDNFKVIDQEQEKVLVPVENDIEPKPDESNTVDEIKQYLDNRGIKYDASTKKAELLKLVGD